MWPFADLLTTLGGVERWLLPPACILCQESVPEPEGDALICRLCRTRWRPIPYPVCLRCGQPSLGNIECRICQSWPAGLGQVRSAVWLTGSARDVVHRLKYDGWTRVSDAMAFAMRRLELLTAGVSLIPVPLGSRRLRIRGYNQSACLAVSLGRAIGAAVRTDALERVRETPTQTALTPEARHANVAGAFRAEKVAGLHVVLVDDVFTTGATLAAAGAALAQAGASRVDAVTFARASQELEARDS